MLRVLLGDHQLSLVEALAEAIAAESDLEVVGTAARADDVLRVVGSRPVDVAVLGSDTGPADLASLGAALREVRPGLALIALADHEDIVALVRAVRAGFRGWVHKEAGVQELVDVVRAVPRGETRIPPVELTRVLDHLLEAGAAATRSGPLDELTSRELEVLRALSGGVTRQEVADELDISVNTVRTHMRRILAKLGVHTSLEAVVIARRAGFR
ncbi:response regulator transcription factor [Geodermatophilus marinus]|uniref:response regulator transcription factor n=1 Tax=Geodermatophilus sp. LHW52908 TaxID=2303986 RepID=UPI001314FFC8|nr:response regulator transcription factor [Geodermatophilus sp. LHW52908]